MISRIVISGLLMGITIMPIAGAVDLTGSTATEEQKEIASQKLNAAVDAAQRWLAIVDSGKYRDSWREASGFFKDKVPDNQWETSLRQIRPPFGRLLTRQLGDVQYTTFVPSAPAGEYVIIQFKTDFQDKHGSIETVTVMLDGDGTWRVSGYYIR